MTALDIEPHAATEALHPAMLVQPARRAAYERLVAIAHDLLYLSQLADQAVEIGYPFPLKPKDLEHTTRRILRLADRVEV